jgi:hypothetical protein
MDDASHLPFFITLVATIVATQQLLAAYTVLFDDVPTKWEKRMAKKRKRELTPYKRNVSVRYSRPTSALEPVNMLQHILNDTNRGYMHKLTHLHEWQFFLLADRLKDLILRPRLRNDGTRPLRTCKPPKHDYFHRLFFA